MHVHWRFEELCLSSINSTLVFTLTLRNICITSLNDMPFRLTPLIETIVSPGCISFRSTVITSSITTPYLVFVTRIPNPICLVSEFALYTRRIDSALVVVVVVAAVVDSDDVVVLFLFRITTCSTFFLTARFGK